MDKIDIDNVWYIFVRLLFPFAIVSIYLFIRKHQKKLNIISYVLAVSIIPIFLTIIYQFLEISVFLNELVVFSLASSIIAVFETYNNYEEIEDIHKKLENHKNDTIAEEKITVDRLGNEFINSTKLHTTLRGLAQSIRTITVFFLIYVMIAWGIAFYHDFRDTSRISATTLMMGAFAICAFVIILLFHYKTVKLIDKIHERDICFLNKLFRIALIKDVEDSKLRDSLRKQELW